MAPLQSPLVTCINLLLEASAELSTPIPPLNAERIGIFISEAMSTGVREFHDLEHAVDIASASNPIVKLAGLFHDVVYVQIDAAQLPELKKAFSPCELNDALELEIKPEYLNHEPVKLVSIIFGVKPGQILAATSGLNEFLSALVAYHFLKPFLHRTDLIGVICAIEATIPFRTNPLSEQPEEYLNRIRTAADLMGTTISSERTDNLMNAAVEVANRDVKGFTHPDPSVFIRDSWALLYETNPDLQKRFYLLPTYLAAVNRMDNFFQHLNVKLILRRFKNFPDEKTFSEYVRCCELNVKTGQHYTALKLIEVSLLNAIAECSGGETPADFFYGARPGAKGNRYAKLEDFLQIPKTLIPGAFQAGIFTETFNLLLKGSADEVHFDNKTSYLSAFLFSQIKSETELGGLYTASKNYASGSSHAYEYLAHFDTELLVKVVTAISQIAPTRKIEFQAVLKRVSEYSVTT